MINISFCIEDVQQFLRTDKNGKRWLSLSVSERKEVGKYGDTHTVYYYDRDTKEKTYCGGGKEIVFGAKKNDNEVKFAPPTDDDIPF